jgi:hypothetical protein
MWAAAGRGERAPAAVFRMQGAALLQRGVPEAALGTAQGEVQQHEGAEGATGQAVLDVTWHTG